MSFRESVQSNDHIVVAQDDEELQPTDTNAFEELHGPMIVCKQTTCDEMLPSKALCQYPSESALTKFSTTIKAQNVHYGDIHVKHPQELMIKQEEDMKFRLIREMSMKLKNQYQHWEIAAIPWMKDFYFPLDDYDVDLKLLSQDNMEHLYNNQTFDIEELFLSNDRQEIYRIVIEGQPGYGKTTFSWKLAYDWSKGAEYISQFRLVILLQLRYLDCTLQEAIESQISLMGYDTNVLFHIVMDAADDVLLILDGYDEIPSKSAEREIKSLFAQNIFSSMTVVMTTRPNSDLFSDLRKMCQRRLAIIGLSSEQQQKFLKNSQLDDKQCQTIKILLEAPNTKNLFQCPLLFILLCFLASDTGIPEPLTTFVLYSRMLNYMVRMSIYREEKDISVDLFNSERSHRKPTRIVEALGRFGGIVLDEFSEMKLSFTKDEILTACDDLIVTELGILNQTSKIQMWRSKEFFEPIHKTLLELLAAYHLEGLSHDNPDEYHAKIRILTKNPSVFLDILPFLVGLLNERSIDFFSQLPIYTFRQFSNSLLSVIEETAEGARHSIMEHFPRELELTCFVRSGGQPIFLKCWDALFVAPVWRYFNALCSHVPISVNLIFQIFDEETLKSNSEDSMIKEMPFDTQIAEKQLVNKKNLYILHELHGLKCDRLRIGSFILFDKEDQPSYIEVAKTIYQLQPRYLNLSGFWRPESIALLLHHLNSLDFCLQELELNDYSIETVEDAEILASSIKQFQMQNLTISDSFNIINYCHLHPIYHALIASPMSQLKVLHLEISTNILQFVQEQVDILVACIEVSTTLDEFAFIASSKWFFHPVLVFNVCQMCKHGAKKMRKLVFNRALPTVSCFCVAESSNSCPKLQIETLEILCDKEPDFQPDKCAKTIAACCGLQKLFFDVTLAACAVDIIPNDWACFFTIKKVRLIVVKEFTLKSWTFLLKFQHYVTLSLDFRVPASTHNGAEVINRDVWIDFWKSSEFRPVVVELKFSHISKLWGDILKEFLIGLASYTTEEKQTFPLEIRLRFLDGFYNVTDSEPLITFAKALGEYPFVETLIISLRERRVFNENAFTQLEDAFISSEFNVITKRKHCDKFVISICKRIPTDY